MKGICVLQRKNKNLHVVKSIEERTDKLMKDIMSDGNGGDGQTDSPDEQIRQHRKRVTRKTVIVCITVLVVVTALFLFIQLQTYTKVRTIDTYTIAGAADSNYKQFADGVLKYSRDGISYLNQNGEEQWNQAYQIKNPFVVTNTTSAAVADKGGNDIIVFREEGVKGEIHTTLPIQKITVSEQGIVCAILKQENMPKIICYDMAGNVLVEHKASAEGMGYPLNVSISPNGEVVQALYLYTRDGKITSKVVYYNFAEAGEDQTDRQVTYEEYENTIMAEGFFMSQNVSVAAGDNCLLIYKGNDVPKETVKIELKKEIKSVFHSDKYIGLVLKNTGKGGYELRLYDMAGKQILSEDFSGDYGNVKMCGNQVIMYDRTRCCIFTRRGIHKFQGEADNTILEIFPVSGINKYIMMNTNGMEHIRIVK